MKKFIILALAFTFIFGVFPKLEANCQVQMNMKIGDYLEMGKYNNEPILWRCIGYDENGPLMLSDKILTIKPFDAKGLHKYLDGTNQTNINNSRTDFGSNYWETSCIRSWLNSIEPDGQVKWLDGCLPTEKNVYNGLNDYADEKGFLADGNFTAKERQLIKSVTQHCILNNADLDKQDGGDQFLQMDLTIASVLQAKNNFYYQKVTDKMFLLDIRQIIKLSNRFTSKYIAGKLKQKAIEKSEYKINVLKDSYWDTWLRTPCAGNDNCVLLVNTNGSISKALSINNNIGVRPAFYLDISLASLKGMGSEDSPYIIEGTTESNQNKIQNSQLIDFNNISMINIINYVFRYAPILIEY